MCGLDFHLIKSFPSSDTVNKGQFLNGITLKVIVCFSCSVQLNLANIAGSSETKSGEGDNDSFGREEGSDHNEDVPPGLLLWRRAVQNAQTPAQLNLCTQLLGNSIAWEKSIMRVVSFCCFFNFFYLVAQMFLLTIKRFYFFILSSSFSGDNGR